MTTDLAHPATVAPFADRHAVLPSRSEHWFEYALLLMVAAGDFIAFWIVLQRTFVNMDQWVLVLLTASVSAASVLLMHIAGKQAREIKANNSAHGWRPVWLLIGGWLALGLTAFAVRISVELTNTSGGFGASEEAASLVEVLPSAFLLLAIFLAGGAAAYLIGFKLHNPARKAYLRVQRRLRTADKRVKKLVKRETKAMVAADRLRSQVASLERQHAADEAALTAEAGQLRSRTLLDLSAATAAHHAARVAEHQAVAVEMDARRAALVEDVSATTSATALSKQEELAAAQVAALKELLRTHIAESTADPAATSAILPPTDDQRSPTGSLDNR